MDKLKGNYFIQIKLECICTCKTQEAYLYLGLNMNGVFDHFTCFKFVFHKYHK